jgi:RNA polymerase sigma factor (sigma-70 family)
MASGLEAIFLEHRATLLRFLRARGAGDACEDLLQEMWLRLSSRDLGPIADPLPYLHRMANNLMLDRYRSSVRRERREQDWSGGGTGEFTEQSPEPNADERLIAAERLTQVQAELDRLGPRVEQVFRRFRLEGMGQKAIAEDLGVSLTTVEKDLQKAYRALAALKQRFDAE